MRTERAPGPLSIMMSITKSSIAEYRYSSTTGERRCISSMKSTSPSSRDVRSPAKSPGLSNMGPEVTFMFTPSSFDIICASVVFPSPGGPWNSTWSSDSPLILAAATKILRLDTILSCPVKSCKSCGRIIPSNSLSLPSLILRGSKSVAMSNNKIIIYKYRYIF